MRREEDRTPWTCATLVPWLGVCSPVSKCQSYPIREVLGVHNNPMSWGVFSHFTDENTSKAHGEWWTRIRTQGSLILWAAYAYPGRG